MVPPYGLERRVPHVRGVRAHVEEEDQGEDCEGEGDELHGEGYL